MTVDNETSSSNYLMENGRQTVILGYTSSFAESDIKCDAKIYGFYGGFKGWVYMSNSIECVINKTN